MSETEKKPRVGVALLNLPATFGESRLKKETDENGKLVAYDVAWEKEINAMERLEQVAKDMDLETIFILGVSPEVVGLTSDGKIFYDKGTTRRDCWNLGKALHYGTHIWYQTIYYDGDKPLTPHLRYLGTVGCNCFFTPDYSQFAKQNGEPVKFDRKTARMLRRREISLELDPPDNITSFDYNDWTFKCLTRITKNHDISIEERFGEPCFKKTAENMLKQLGELKEKYDIRQVIVCTNGLTEQDDIRNMLDGNEISQVCGAPVFEIWTNIFDPFLQESSNTINPEGDGFKGTCVAGDYCAFGFSIGMNIFSEYINKTKATNPAIKDLVNKKGNQ